LQAANDSHLAEQCLTRDLQAAQASLKEFELSRSELGTQRESEITKAQATLDGMLKEHNALLE
jgi:hypothetical protein